LTNARPNVALSCRTMKHREESKADLRFLIDSKSSKPVDIPVTLVYCNQRLTCEDAYDSLRRWARDENIPEDCIAFYHAKVGQAQKRNLEERLRKGEIRILFCTDAVGMRCDMRNIEQVILWGLPPSFFSLVQRAGRAARDFSKIGEAILITTTPPWPPVPPSVIKNGFQGRRLKQQLSNITDGESENRGLDVAADLLDQGIELTSGHEWVIVGEGSIRSGKDYDDEDGEAAEVKHKRRKKLSKECSSREADFLSRFACTTKCRRKIWDLFFNNDSKEQLKFPENTTYQQGVLTKEIPDTRLKNWIRA
ncbi:P-loop containing nucleoside triphosphate hydrolase protein, partial [Mycena leptocephala]